MDAYMLCSSISGSLKLGGNQSSQRMLDGPSSSPVRPAAVSCHTCTIATSQWEIYVESLGFQFVFPAFWGPVSDSSSVPLRCFVFKMCCSVHNKWGPLMNHYYIRVSFSFVWLLCVRGHHYHSIRMLKRDTDVRIKLGPVWTLAQIYGDIWKW